MVSAGLPAVSVPAAAEGACGSLPPATPTFDGGVGGWPSDTDASQWRSIRNDPNAYWGPMSAFATTVHVHGVPGCSAGPGYTIAGYSWDVVPFGTSTPLAQSIREDACREPNCMPWQLSLLFEAPSAFGSYTLRVAAVSGEGVWSGVATYSFGVDRIAPVIEFVEPSPGERDVSPQSQVRVRYSDLDVVDGVERDALQAGTRVDPHSVRLHVDGIDVQEREKAECTQLGQGGPILGPAQDGAWQAVLGLYEEVLGFLGGKHSLGPLRAVLSNDRSGLSGALWQAQQMAGTPHGDDVPVYGDALGRACSRTVATQDEFAYTPLKPWASGPHSAFVRLADEALGFRPNEQSFAWEFSVA